MEGPHLLKTTSLETSGLEVFIKRNPKVKLRKARPLEKKRARISKDAVDTWFTDFEAFLIEKGLANCPAQIWNCDETGSTYKGGLEQ